MTTELDACAARATRIELPCGDGVIVWHHWRAVTAFPRLQPIVLFHGGSGSWLHWIRQIDHLTAKRDVWCADLPGLGDSAMPPEPFTPESAARVLVMNLAHLLADQRPHLMGFSFGSHVATYVAHAIGDQLSSLVLTGSAALGLAHPHFMFAKERHGQTDDDQRAVHRRNLELLMFADPRLVDDLAIEIQARNVRSARFKSRLFAASDDIPRLLPGIACQIGAIWGDQDNILVASHTPVARVFEILQAGGRQVKTATLEGAGHWAAYEAADRFNDALDRMLAGFEAA